MSQPKRMTFTSREVGGGQTSKTEWVLLEDYELLKAEVERLRASSFVTAVPVEEYEKLKAVVERLTAELDQAECDYDNCQKRKVSIDNHRFDLFTENKTLKAENERLRKAGDALAETLEGAGFDSAMDFWNAAKEGKQP